MQLNRPIPSKITVASRTCFVFYRGQPRTCFKCGESGHQKNNYPRNATRTDTISGLASTSTWGDQHPEGDIAVVTTNPHADSLTTSTATASTEQINTAHLSLSADQPLANTTTPSTTSTAITLPVDNKDTPKPISITPKQLTTMRQSSQKTGVKRLLSQQSTTSTIKGPWVHKSTKPSIPPNPKCTNSFGILAGQPNTDLEEDISDEETIPALPDSHSMEDSSTEESSGEESEEEYTPILDKVTGDLITKKKPTEGPTIPNAPLLSSDSSEHTNG